MNLGNFSISLAVKDIAASRAFYTALGFAEVGGDIDQRWLVLKNGSTKVGLFQGMFDRNVLTFNPGWDSDGNAVADFTDVRVLKQHLHAAGIDTGAAIESTAGPAHFMLTDPDGNPVLVDQHV